MALVGLIDMQKKRWSDEEMARRKRMANRLVMASFLVFCVSLMPMYWVTCTKMFSEYYLVNNLGPISESHNQWVALLVCGFFVLSGVLAGFAMAAVKDIRKEGWHLLFLSFGVFLFHSWYFLMDGIYMETLFFAGDVKPARVKGLCFSGGGNFGQGDAHLLWQPHFL